MPELNTTLPAWDEENPPEITDAELEAYFNEATAGETRREAAGETRPVCPACEAGDHEHSWITERDYKCACPCHTDPCELREIHTPRKQTDLREFYTNPVAFGMKLALRRAA